jgi:hypothetical protein
MRVRTAIAIAAAIVVAEGATTWVAFHALAEIPHRNWAVNQWHWHIALGTLAEWLAAGGSITAAVVALGIATADRRERTREHRDADRAQAKLVIVTVTMQTDHLQKEHPSYPMHCKNNGAQPILDVEVVAAKMQAHPGSIAELANWTTPLVNVGGHVTVNVHFVTNEGEPLPPRLDTPDRFRVWPDINSLQIVGWVGFSDAFGNRWARSSDGDLKRITHDSQLADLVRPYRVRKAP